VWKEHGVQPKECDWISTSFHLPAESDGRNLEHCEVDSIVQRSSSQVVHAMEDEEKDRWKTMCMDKLKIDDLRSMLFVHPLKKRSDYAAILEVFGLLK